MTLAELKRRLPPRAMGFLVVGALIAFGFMALFIVPDYHHSQDMTQENGRLRTSLEVRRQLLPVVEALRKAEAALPAVGAKTGATRLPLSDVGKLNTIMADLVASSGMQLTQVSPDPSSVTRDGILAVRLGFLGDPDKFRDVLLALGRYAPLVKIESVVSSVGQDGREYRVKCWLAVG